MKINVHPSLEVSLIQVNKGWRKHKGKLKKAFEEIGSDVEDRLARTEALKRIGTAFPLGSGMVDKWDFPFLFPFRIGTTVGASNSSVTGMSVVKAPFSKHRRTSFN
jgi:hypothetical protein